MAHDLDFLFEPRSVALVGASPNPVKWGYFMSKQLIESGYQGDIYLIATKGGVIFGRETYKNIFDIKNVIDVVIIGVPATFVPDIVKDCIKKGTKGIIVITAGFGETGKEGKRVEKELLETARKGGARIVGPNCLGVYNSSINLNTTPLSLPKGSFAFLTQSGNFAMDVNYNARRRGLGYCKFVSFGNQIDIFFHEYLDYVKDDPDTEVILLYMEGLLEGREFLKVAKETTKKKPVVAIKAGISSAGIRSAASHTGSLAGTDEIYGAALKQVGIIRVADSSELLDVAETLAKCPLPQGNRIAILTDGGGHGTMGSDAAQEYNLEVPVLSTKTQEKLRQILPPQASVKNPVDFAGGAEADLWNFVRCSEILLQDEDIDGLLIVGQYGGYGIELASEFLELEEKVSLEITDLAKKYHKPIINHTMYQQDDPKSLQILRNGGVPVYSAVETAVRCMSSLVEYRGYLDGLKEDKGEGAMSLPNNRLMKVKEIIGDIKDAGRLNLMETEAREILKAYSLPMLDFRLARSKDEAIKISQEMGYPLAMKIVSPNIIHKSDAGGVKLGLKNKEHVGKAFGEIIDSIRKYDKEVEIFGVIITPMEDKGTEIIIGVTNDQTFGPTVMFGLGGIFVEVLKDVSFRVAPLCERDAYEMVREIKGYPMLKGVRGQKAKDIDAIVDIILKVSMLVLENEVISELDLNPIFVFEKGASIADVRMMLSGG